MSCAITISDLVCRLKNHRVFSNLPCNVKKNNLSQECLKLLCQIGFIMHYKDSPKSAYELEVFINSSVLSKNPFSDAKSITKPSRKKYCSSAEIAYMQKKSPLNTILVSTSFGVFTARTCMEKNIGGEVLFIV